MNYRGFEMPEPTKHGNTWIVNDGAFGYFSGHKEHVTNMWRNAVERYTQHEALGAGEYDYYGEGWTCLKCGAGVNDPWIHNNWHGDA